MDLLGKTPRFWFPATLGNNPLQASSGSVEKENHFVRQALAPGTRPVPSGSVRNIDEPSNLVA